MIELPLVFLAGVLGSSHCLGMCGPFALALGSARPRWGANLPRQLLYTLGRIFTYAFLGALAGYASQRLQQQLAILVPVASLLAIAAGLFLIYQGLLAAGILVRRVSGQGPCLAGGVLMTWLRSPHWQDTFLAGVFTGLIPCGLVYGFLALAATTGSMGQAALIMVAFGAGTAPLMILAGCGGSLLDVALRRHLLKVAALCVVITGLFSIVRGMSGLMGGLGSSGWGGGCPLCP